MDLKLKNLSVKKEIKRMLKLYGQWNRHQEVSVWKASTKLPRQKFVPSHPIPSQPIPKAEVKNNIAKNLDDNNDNKKPR